MQSWRIEQLEQRAAVRVAARTGAALRALRAGNERAAGASVPVERVSAEEVSMFCGRVPEYWRIVPRAIPPESDKATRSIDRHPDVTSWQAHWVTDCYASGSQAAWLCCHLSATSARNVAVTDGGRTFNDPARILIEIDNLHGLTIGS
jgi:hypothetical protein